VIQHPATFHETRVWTEQLLAELAAEPSPDVFATAQERGRARDLHATTAELLEILADA